MLLILPAWKSGRKLPNVFFSATHKTRQVSNKTGKINNFGLHPNLLGKIKTKLQDATHQNGSQCNGKNHLHPIARSHEPPSCRCDNAATNVWWLQPTWHRDGNVFMLVASCSLAADTWKACPNHPEYRNRASNRSNFNVLWYQALCHPWFSSKQKTSSFPWHLSATL